jgi:hypothetical protein
VILEIAAAIWFIWIAIYDFRFKLIRNVDLLIAFILCTTYISSNWYVGFVNLGIYGLLNLLSKDKIGSGDIKLAPIIALPVSSIYELLNALSISWISGGLYALIRGGGAIAFAPFMILGTYLAKIL